MHLARLPASVYRALIRREVITTFHNRFVQIFAVVAWAGSIAVAALSGRPEAVPYGLLLLFLYLVPLFGLLVGVSAAHEERDERALLWSQPVPRAAFVLGKAVTLIVALAAVLLGALVAGGVVGASAGTLALLWGLGAGVVLVSVGAGLAAGQYTTNRARGLMVVLVVWVVAFALYDAAALGLSGLGAMQAVPAFWAGLLLLNPIDAVRLAGLFALEDVPFSAPGDAAWMGDLMAGLPAWVAVLTAVWTGGLLLLACRRLRRLDL